MSETFLRLFDVSRAVRDQAAEALVEHGWTQGEYRRSPNFFPGQADDPKAAGICASSAVQVALGMFAQPLTHQEAVRQVGWERTFVMHAVKRAFVMHLARANPWYNTIYNLPPVYRAPFQINLLTLRAAPVGTQYYDGRIVDFNDNICKNGGQVLDALMSLNDSTLREALSYELDPTGQVPQVPTIDPARLQLGTHTVDSRFDQKPAAVLPSQQDYWSDYFTQQQLTSSAAATSSLVFA